MTRVLLLVLILGSVVCGATNFPSHIGMGSKASTVGKISSYSRVGGGLWTGYWKPNWLTTRVDEEKGQIFFANAWPNPTTGVFNINHQGHVKVYSQVGGLVFEGETSGTIDISGSATGLYFVRTEDGITFRIIKQ